MAHRRITPALAAIVADAPHPEHWPFPSKAAEAAPKQSALTQQHGGNHYKALKIQPIEYIHANGIPFSEGNVIKYVSRWRAKNGIQDLRKAVQTLEQLIELEERGANA